MRRKVYTTDRERKGDQAIGFVAFPIVNVALWIVTNRMLTHAVTTFPRLSYGQAQTGILLIPWLVNGLVIVLAFLFRPEIGKGYVVWIGMIFCLYIAPSTVFIAACFTAAAVASALSLGPVIFGVIFLGLIVGAIWLGWQVLAWVIRRWR